MAFIFGGNTGNTYEGIQRQRKIAESLLAQSSGTPRNVGEGLTAIGNALASRAIEKRAAKAEEKLRGEFDTAFSGVFGGGQAQQPAYSAPASASAPVGFTQNPSDPSVIGDDAMAALGKAPTWLSYSNQGATRNDPISPELVSSMGFLGDMGITMDVVSGGQDAAGSGGARTGSTRHDHGNAADVDFYSNGRKLDWNNPADLPVLQEIVRTAKARGVTGIGAGDDYMGAGRFHIGFGSPAVWGAGGNSKNAPAWLVEAYNGGSGQAQPAQAPQIDLSALVDLASNPMASPGQKAVLEALIGQQMDAADPMRQIELQRAQLELAQMQNPKVDPMAAIELQQAQLNLEQDRAGAGAAAKEYGLTPQYGTDKDGNLVAIQFAKDGTSIATPLPEGVALSKGIEKLDLGDSYQYVNTMTGEYVGNPIAKNTAAEAANVVAGKAKGEAQAALDSLTAKMPGLETVVAELNDLADKATYTLGGQVWDATVKQFGGAPSASAIARAEYIAKVDNQVLPLLKDTFGAAFTAKEGDTLRATLGDPDKSPQEKKAVLNAFIEQKKRDLEALAKQTGNEPSGDTGAMSDDDLLKMYGQ